MTRITLSLISFWRRVGPAGIVGALFALRAMRACSLRAAEAEAAEARTRMARPRGPISSRWRHLLDRQRSPSLWRWQFSELATKLHPNCGTPRKVTRPHQKQSKNLHRSGTLVLNSATLQA